MKYHLKQLLFISLLMTATTVKVKSQSVSYPDDPRSFIVEKLVDLTHIQAELHIDGQTKNVEATATIRFSDLRIGVDSLVFYCPKFLIGALTVDGKTSVFKQAGDYLIVKRNGQVNTRSDHEIMIKYSVSEPKEMYFVGWDDPSGIMRKQIWAHRPAGWLPYAPDRLTMDFRITFDGRFQVFSNGIRESVVDNQDGSKTWHYFLDKEHPFFSTALVIGDYKWQNLETKSGVPVELWYYPEREGWLDATYPYMLQMFDFCEKEFGVAYPYSAYKQAPVADYLYGGMETTTSTVFGDYMHIDGRAFWERNYINVNVHELIHNWFGNDISHLRDKDVWLTESFATYYAKRFEKEIFGDNNYQWERQKELERVLKASETDHYPVGSSRGGTERWYPKGSLVLDMLRDELGDDNFRKAINWYLTKHRQSEVWTPDLEKAIFESTGRSMSWFFDQWIYRGGEPHYRIQYEDNGAGLLVKVEQIQEINELMPVFKAKLNFELGYADGSRRIFSIDNNQREQLFVIPKEMELLYILFDPGDRLLKKVTFERPLYDRFDQLLNTPLMIDKYKALVELREVPMDQKREILYIAYKKGPYHLVKSEILSQLAADTARQGIEVFRQALLDEDVLVRRGALNVVNATQKGLLKELESCLTDTSYTNIILAMNALCKINPDEAGRYLRMTKNERGFPGLNVRIVWLELAVRNGDAKYKKELIQYATRSYDFRTRINALEAIMRLNLYNPEVANAIQDAVNHWNFKLRAAGQKADLHFKVNR